MVFIFFDGSKLIKYVVYDFIDGGGVVMGMFNIDEVNRLI